MKLKDSTQPPDISARTAWQRGEADLKMPRRGPIRLWKGHFKLSLPRRTVRLRLTLLYSSLFLALDAGLLAMTYVLVARRITRPGAVPVGTPSSASSSEPLAQLLHAQAVADLHQFLIQSGIALSIIAVVTIVLGWIVAGRVLRPLQIMTATTRQISEENLHERLALPGPPDELKDLGDTIDGLLARLEAAFEGQRRFVANAAHELRTPLTMMRTSLDVAVGKPGPAPPEVTILAGKLREGLNQADRLVESFLALARAQQGTLTDLTSVSLPQLVSATLAACSDAIAGRGLQVRQTLSNADVIGSKTLLVRLVENLIDNAICYNTPGGFIRVATADDGAAAHLVVESDGPLLDERKVQELGQPFRRLGADRTAMDGSIGLGLSIVAAIVAAHDGSLGLHARPEGGLQVVITLPHARRRREPGDRT
ncbi:MAG: HAMP domain-containing histidine kinase [Chloroflexota bacterium]|nr:HAMP domain-containing histidine kinase [Chloroflexota bacterium]